MHAPILNASPAVHYSRPSGAAPTTAATPADKRHTATVTKSKKHQVDVFRFGDYRVLRKCQVPSLGTWQKVCGRLSIASVSVTEHSSVHFEHLRLCVTASVTFQVSGQNVPSPLS